MMKWLKIRLKLIFHILFKPSAHWFFIEIEPEDLKALFRDEYYGVEVRYHRVQPYVIHKIIGDISENSYETILLKAAFQAEAELHHLQKKNK